MSVFKIEEVIHYADVLAIPLFFLAFIYFLRKQNKTVIEYILMLFVLCGLLLDLTFSYQFLTGGPTCSNM